MGPLNINSYLLYIITTFSVLRNFTIRKMPFPVNDAAIAMKVNPERTEIALQKVISIYGGGGGGGGERNKNQ